MTHRLCTSYIHIFFIAIFSCSLLSRELNAAETEYTRIGDKPRILIADIQLSPALSKDVNPDFLRRSIEENVSLAFGNRINIVPLSVRESGLLIEYFRKRDRLGETSLPDTSKSPLEADYAIFLSVQERDDITDENGQHYLQVFGNVVNLKTLNTVTSNERWWVTYPPGKKPGYYLFQLFSRDTLTKWYSANRLFVPTKFSHLYVDKNIVEQFEKLLSLSNVNKEQVIIEKICLNRKFQGQEYQKKCSNMRTCIDRKEQCLSFFYGERPFRYYLELVLTNGNKIDGPERSNNNMRPFMFIGEVFEGITLVEIVASDLKFAVNDEGLTNPQDFPKYVVVKVKHGKQSLRFKIDSENQDDGVFIRLKRDGQPIKVTLEAWGYKGKPKTRKYQHPDVQNWQATESQFVIILHNANFQ